ncbi:MAG: aldehyde dehydrogenase family protein [Lachnospiraceae bacterium]|nr:aldehyde dehydrogenase family protein [Lachnospiraceae bacterium]
MSHTPASIHQIVSTQREYFNTGATLPVDFRIRQLKKLKETVKRHEADMIDALHADLGRHSTEAFFCDIGTIIAEINEALHGVRRWARPERHFSGLICFPSVTTRVYKMPYGVSLIISPFNFPFLLTFGVLTAAIAGGNTAVLKTSSKTPNCTKVISDIVAEAFPPEYVTVVDGGHDVADMCLAESFDKIFYTGSPRVGVHVLTEAARNLTSTALELGGETGNWCIVRRDADIKDAARKIAFFKTCNSGQICININQVAVAKEIVPEFIEALKAEFTRQLGSDPSKNEEYATLVSQAAYDKCALEADMYRDRIVYGGTGDREAKRYSPTVIYPVDIDEPIVMHELFCPLLPIVPFEDGKVDELLKTVTAREKGLSLYVFTKNKKWANRVMSTMQFGGGCINEVCLQIMVKNVPFNGVGHSGMGAYHGEWGFREFTHPQTVLTGSTRFNLPLREHPYTGKDWKMKMVKFFEK